MSLINEALHNLDERQGASAEEIVETQPAAPPPKRRSSFAGTLRGTLWIAVACGIGYVVWTTNPATVLQVQSEAEAVVDNLLDEAAVVIGALWDDQEAQQSAVKPQSGTSSLSADGTNSTGQGGEAKAATVAANFNRCSFNHPAVTRPSREAIDTSARTRAAPVATVASTTAAVTSAAKHRSRTWHSTVAAAPVAVKHRCGDT